MGNVITPDRYKEVVVDPMTKTREMLFVGAISNLAEQLAKLYDDKDIHTLALSAREHIAKVAHDHDHQPGSGTFTPELSNDGKEACTRALMEILAIAGKLNINVALGALRLYHTDKSEKEAAIQVATEEKVIV